MCFSAQASFTASAFLIPTGIYCLKTAIAKDKKYGLVACLPLAFGIQQGFEGVVWLGMASSSPGLTHTSSLGFLFFSHWFWLIWVPLSAFVLEHNRTIKKALFGLTVAGALYGTALYIPLLLNQPPFSIAVSHHSIEYQLKLIFDPILPKLLVQLFYGVIVIIPFLISSNYKLRFFGALLFVSAVVTNLVLNYAFISVWCFFAAILSFYIAYIVMHKIPMVSVKS